MKILITNNTSVNLQYQYFTKASFCLKQGGIKICQLSVKLKRITFSTTTYHSMGNNSFLAFNENKMTGKSIFKRNP